MRYFVDKENGIVKATIDGCDKDVYKLVLKRMKIAHLFNPVVLYDVLKLNKRYVGVAKCAPTDTFNEEIGRIMAARRASVKYERARLKAIERLQKYLEEILWIEIDQRDRWTLAEVRNEDSKNIVDIYEQLI